jgi:hypothetical protein
LNGVLGVKKARSRGFALAGLFEDLDLEELDA